MSTPRSILFLNRFYWPDVAATGQLLTDLAEDLAAMGWQVSVVTSRSGYRAAGDRLLREERRNGVRIVRVDTTRFGRDRLVGRLGDYLSYSAGAFWRLLRMPRADVVVAMSDPPLVLAPALLAGRLRGFRTLYWVQDVYPHLAGRLGVLKEGGPAYRAACAAARRLHAAADGVITVGPRMSRTILGSGGHPDRTAHVHNWTDTVAVRPVPPSENPFLHEHGLEGRFVVLYSGNAGRAHTFEAVLEAMRRLRDEPDLVFLFVGGGKQFPAIRQVAEREALDNVRFLDYVPREQLRYSLSAAGASLVTENPDVVGMLVPSKTYGIMASGRPLVFVGSQESDVAEIVRAAGCGLIVSPDDSRGLVAAIRRLKDNPEEADRLGNRGREAAETLYDRRLATRRWATVCHELLAPRSAS